MRVNELVHSIKALEEDQRKYAQALQIAMNGGSPDHVIKGLTNDWKKSFNEYHRIMQLEVIFGDDERFKRL